MSALTELRRKIASDSCKFATFQKNQGVRDENAATVTHEEPRHSPDVSTSVAGRRQYGSQPEESVTRAVVEESQSRKTRSGLAHRRNILREMMDSAPESTTHFYLTDDRSDPEYVILAIGLRGIGTAELSIPRERYDPFALVKVIAAAHGSSRSEAGRDGGDELGTVETP